ncbi:protein GLUTAMINE DUMPER 5-like [Impatiens glandulifera]|uniref:protein GLUTAMINE DUMPER 5-like n=1 Tax=Impatiens glandulifera TaxID=253017 RepID=UPI001FB05C52|nr:protein GLUTAMINE DUMPER 5-like [Impatiens glandulifera]
MRAAATNSTTSGAGNVTGAGISNAGLINGWKSPTPYLFGGLTLMLLLIAVSLIILFWNRRSSRRTQNGADNDDQKSEASPEILPAPEMEPRIVVIMPGHDNPTYLGYPRANLHIAQQQA